MADIKTIDQVFEAYNQSMETDAQIVDIIKKHVQLFYKDINNLQAQFQRLHSNPSDQKVLEELDGKLSGFAAILKEIKEAIPELSVNNLQALTYFLRHSALITYEETCDQLGVSMDPRGFHIELEDYLFGVLLAGNEMSRLAVNAVTVGHIELPRKIHTFLDQLSSGFRLLALRNDFVRRKYDGLKYDLKRVEEVLYDLALRDIPPSAAE